MIPSADYSSFLAADPKALLRDMRSRTQSESDGGLKAVAQQFEAIFLEMMLKSMRATKFANTAFENEGTRQFTGMLDQQMSARLSRAKGLGLADLIVRQLAPRDAAAPVSLHGAAAPLPVKKSAHLP